MISDSSNEFTQGTEAVGLSAQGLNTKTAAKSDSLDLPNGHVGAATSGVHSKIKLLLLYEESGSSDAVVAKTSPEPRMTTTRVKGPARETGRRDPRKERGATAKREGPSMETRAAKRCKMAS